MRTFGRAVAVLCLSCSVGGASSAPLASAASTAEPFLPEVRQTGWVTDAAGVIPAAVERRLAVKLAKFERRTLHELVVVTVPTLAGRDETEVANHLGNTWGVGRRGHDDGIVLLVAPNDRRVRISTADGIRQLLPDAVCQQVIDEDMVPHFRKGDLPAGIEAGTDALIAHLG